MCLLVEAVLLWNSQGLRAAAPNRKDDIQFSSLLRPQTTWEYHEKEICIFHKIRKFFLKQLI
jgi:hypothetical protein